MRHSALLRLLLFIVFSIGLLTLTACSFSDYETNIHKINEEFDNVSIKTDTAVIAFVPSNDGMCRVACYEDAKSIHSVEIQNGTLMINVVNHKKWYDYIGDNINSPKITVYLPEKAYSSLVIEESTGISRYQRILNLRVLIFHSVQVMLSAMLRLWRILQ